MGEIVCDGTEFFCPHCQGGPLKTVVISQVDGESKTLASETNAFIPPPGGVCQKPSPNPPKPCLGAPPGASPGQSKVEIDGAKALGSGCKFTCFMGEKIGVKSPGQTPVTHGTASGAKGADMPSPSKK